MPSSTSPFSNKRKQLLKGWKKVKKSKKKYEGIFSYLSPLSPTLSCFLPLSPIFSLLHFPTFTMSQRQLVKVLPPEDWYDILAKQYKSFHNYLDSFDAWSWQKYLPRQMDWKIMLDIGAGDWRIYNYVRQYDQLNFIAMDISAKILKQHPKSKNITKKKTDLEWHWDIDDDSIDILTAFFVIDYLQDLEHFTSEISRVLKKWWTSIFWYFIQKKSTIYKSDDWDFKIKRKFWLISDIIWALEYEYLKVSCNKVEDKYWALLWYHIICEKE